MIRAIQGRLLVRPDIDRKDPTQMPFERAADHPEYELGENRITSLAAPARGSEEVAFFRIDIPAGGGLPPHHHDHIDVFVVERGGGTFHIGEETFEIGVGDSVTVPVGEIHYLEAGPDGATVAATMLAGTRLFRTDGTVVTPPWVI